MSSISYLACYTSLVWLHRGGVPSRILCIAQDPRELAETLGRWSGETVAFTPEDCESRTDEIGARGPFDVILLVSEDAPRLLPLLVGAVAPAGRIYAAIRQSNAAATVAASVAAGLKVCLRSAVAPSLEEPFYIVPDDPGTLAAYLSIRAPRGRARTALRSVALRLGWRPSDGEGALFVLEPT